MKPGTLGEITIVCVLSLSNDYLTGGPSFLLYKMMVSRFMTNWAVAVGVSGEST
jgi:hypothetical protein